jgi:hypothetical protein
MTALLRGAGEGGSKEARRCVVATILLVRILLKDIESDSECSYPSDRRLSTGLLGDACVVPRQRGVWRFRALHLRSSLFLVGSVDKCSIKDPDRLKRGRKLVFFGGFFVGFRVSRRESQFQRFRDPRPLLLTDTTRIVTLKSTLPSPLPSRAKHRGYVRKTNSERKEFRCSRGCVVPQ